MRSIRRLLAIVACAALALVPSRPLAAQDRPRASAGSALTATLVAGGFVIVMRHASSPRTPPTADTAKPENKDDRIELAGLPLKGSQPLLGPRTLELVRAAPPQLGGSFASIPVGTGCVSACSGGARRCSIAPGPRSSRRQTAS